MGGLVEDKYVGSMEAELNARFAPGDSLREMVALQREFGVFSGRHSLPSIAALLDLAPTDTKARRGWFTFLRNLKRVPSDVSKVNGHDRIVTALRKNLTSKSASPVYFTHHSSKTNPAVAIATGTPLIFSSKTYLVVSAPVGK